MATITAVLFLGTSNARTSILAESLLRRVNDGTDGPRFRAYSAGSHPAPTPDPALLAYLSDRNYPTDILRAKSWDEFAGEGAPALDIVITLSNRLIGEVCPVFWTGRPVSSHWPIADDAALDDAARILERRISALAALPLGTFDGVTLQMKLDAIGRS